MKNISYKGYRFPPEVLFSLSFPIRTRAFKKSEFGLFSKETIGLLPPLARDVAEVSIAVTPLREMVKTVDWLTRLL